MPDFSVPCGIIARQLERGNVVPFLGAGASLGPKLGLTSSGSLADQLLPSGSDLSQLLANEASFPEKAPHIRRDLARVSSFYIDASGRDPLRLKMSDIFDHGFEPTKIHLLLAQFAKAQATAGRPQLLIVTTNYDDLMEHALQVCDHPYDLVYYLTDRTDVGASVFWWKYGEPSPQVIAPNELDIDIDRQTVVYKMHGTAMTQRLRTRGKGDAVPLPGTYDSYVITEDDYVEFLARMADQSAIPQLFTSHTIGKHFLFLGYGLGDWNLRVFLRKQQLAMKLASRTSVIDADVRSWAIQKKPSKEAETLWRKRDINLYDMDLNDFADELGRALGLVDTSKNDQGI